ncbi:MAG: hypothetical protein WD225_04170 [Ilumatobacteraceae bacterium]
MSAVRTTFAITALGIAGVLGVACGDDDAEVAADEPVEVTLVDFGFEGLPDSVPAGTAFTVVNEAPAELHELVAFRLPDGEDRPVEELAELEPGELVDTLGEPAAVILAVPDGDPIVAVGDGTLAEPGRYAIMCFIPTGADPDDYLAAAEESEGPPDVEGGPPHFVHGMLAEITVTEG